MAIDNPVLVRNLQDFCTELLRPNPIGVRDRTIVSEDVAVHVADLVRHFRLAVERHEREPSLSSSLVVTAMAVLLYDRATGMMARPDYAFQNLRRELDHALPRIISNGKLDQIGNINLHLKQTSRTIDNLRLIADTRQLVTVAFPETGPGVVILPDDDDVYRFATFVAPNHSCTEPLAPMAKLRVTLREVTDTGRISFSAECGCVYVADGLDFDRN